MQISASYNFFNGDEHLIQSLSRMRDCVDHISIVWQSTSNAGEAIDSEAQKTLNQAYAAQLFDDVIFFDPDLSLERSVNERLKRRIGLDVAINRDATHFLSLDADEFYRPEEFHAARIAISTAGWRSTSVNSFLHVKRPVWRALDVTCCCFITEITSDTKIGVPGFPCANVDPTRSMTAFSESHHHFSPSEVAMYHMNLVRRDIEQKLRNSSTTDRSFLAEVARSIDGWKPGQDFFFPNKGGLQLENVRNEFETFDPGG